MTDILDITDRLGAAAEERDENRLIAYVADHFDEGDAVLRAAIVDGCRRVLNRFPGTPPSVLSRPQIPVHLSEALPQHLVDELHTQVKAGLNDIVREALSERQGLLMQLLIDAGVVARLENGYPGAPS